jgi:hypothetical protein
MEAFVTQIVREYAARTGTTEHFVRRWSRAQVVGPFPKRGGCTVAP